MAQIIFYLNWSCDLIFIAGCGQAFLLGNGECRDEINNPQCGLDGGDCCLYYSNTDDCSKCICNPRPTCISGTHPTVYYGFCDNETNNKECNFHGEDCCGSYINMDRYAYCDFIVNVTSHVCIVHLTQFLYFCSLLWPGQKWAEDFSAAQTKKTFKLLLGHK